MAVHDDDDDTPRKKSRPSEDIEDDDRPLKRKRPRADDDDDEDDEPRMKKVKRSRSGDGGVGAVIPYRNGMALAAYYLGIFGLIPCIIGLGVLGIVPLVLGILGIMKARKDPEAHGTAHAWVGIVLGAVEMLAGCSVIGFFIFSILQNRR